MDVAGNLGVDRARSLMLVKSSFKGFFCFPYVVLPTIFTGHMIDWAHHSFLGNWVFWSNQLLAQYVKRLVLLRDVIILVQLPNLL